MISQQTIEAVLERVDIVRTVSEWVELKRCGSGWAACCPFHEERTPSFHVDERRGIYKCFGCGVGGNAVKFAMEAGRMSFPEAIRHIAAKEGIPVEEETNELTAEQQEKRLRRDNMLVAMEAVQSVFEAEMAGSSAQSRRCAAYAVKRWGAEFCKEAGIGCAPSSVAFMAKMKAAGIGEETLVDTGIVRKDGEKWKLMFAGRVTIPVRDRWGRVVAYTARAVEANAECKYINSPTSELFRKGETVFGLEIARRSRKSADCVYIVEGAPDVLRLQSIGVDNAVAALGTAWTAEQFALLRKSATAVCFIPDCEPAKAGAAHSAGESAVMKNGVMAMQAGFRVTVKEIPADKPDEKRDPDSFITDVGVLRSLEEQDFVMWYAQKRFEEASTQAGRGEIIKEVCGLLAGLEDDTTAEMFIEPLAKKFKEKTAWKLAYKSAKQTRREKERGSDERGGDDDERGLLAKYGFFVADNCYCNYNRQGETVRLSNFVLTPMYAIPDEGSTTRLYKIKNNLGQEAIIPLDPDDHVNLALFRKKINIAGRYVWLGKIDDLMKVEEYVFRHSDEAKRIRTLGWQSEGFFAYGDGIYTDHFIGIDEIGMVHLRDIGTFYLPAYSVMYRDNRLRYAFEKGFTFAHSADITLGEYLDLFVRVFGDNGKVALAFNVATLFRDVIFDMFEMFPIFTIYGKPQSGKSQLGKAMKGMFTSSYKPINYEGETYPAINKALEQTANCPVHFDEFKNSIEWRKIELLKSMWDGVGRGKMKDGDVERVNVNCGVILSGQEMPTIDPALFTRIVLVSVNKTAYTMEERRRFNELMDINRKGVCQLLMQIVGHRERFVEDYPHYVELTRTEVMNALSKKGKQISDRMYMNWVVVLAAWRTIERLIANPPFTYDELMPLCCDMLLEQHKIIERADEVAGFWNFVHVLYQEGRLVAGADYKIDTDVTRLKMHEGPERCFSQPLNILIIRDRRVIQHYQTDKARETKSIVLSQGDMRGYLERSEMCLGMVKRRFFKVNQYGQPQRIVNSDGSMERLIYDTDTALAFDYDKVQKMYDIYLTAVNNLGTNE